MKKERIILGVITTICMIMFFVADIKGHEHNAICFLLLAILASVFKLDYK